MPSVLTHNGRLTLRNPATGHHRTFRVHTQPGGAEFAPGKRVVSLLTGRGLGDDRPFAFVGEGRVWLWKRYRGQQPWVMFARMLERPELYEDRVEYLFETRCRVCNRPLTDPESIRRGVGPDCGGRR